MAHIHGRGLRVSRGGEAPPSYSNTKASLIIKRVGAALSKQGKKTPSKSWPLPCMSPLQVFRRLYRVLRGLISHAA